ncbi:PREDICTED: probable glycosyltransferase At5g03795 [Nelumbo nucifera]|uniref:Exostosin GT47 domain-containing protein n=2 Tax=Nelumbo nucifera TaxID=4432 RepID=A0A822ZWH8_NELNU|nr:PREDICTED: probable glycosyltransferase At5g03795 [Nelumbo nucifera]DAD47236.1 TPA_asm: hypothetical protein HUJ06_017173 [Nelumbo nucifera]
MALFPFLLYYLSGPRLLDSFRSFFFIPTCLALLTSLFILVYVSSTSKFFIHQHHPHLMIKSPIGSSRIPPTTHQIAHDSSHSPSTSAPDVPPESLEASKILPLWNYTREGIENLRYMESHQPIGSNGNPVNNEVFHDKDIFLEDYEEMNRSFKIYVYPHREDDPFANALLPVDFEPGGNYASESYFKRVLMKSHFITKDPSEADLFFLPFSIARLRHDPRVDVGGIPDFIKAYISNISHTYPYWNRTGGADHFYVACHSIGRSAMEKTNEVKFNAIQVVCSSSYFLSGYVAHKDASLPQIWPRQGDPPNLFSSKRKKLAFFAGSVNSPVRQRLIESWENDTDISVHSGRLKTPYTDELLESKFCLHVKGFEVNTARIGDAMYFGCIPVIIANYYDLPFADILNWKHFSLTVATLDIPLLKKILQSVSYDQYSTLQRNLLKVRKHFKWHPFPVDYDAFYMVMYELWLRRSSVVVPLNGWVEL